MKIYYKTIESFYEGIYQLTVKGLGFEADVDRLIIELTGGY